MGTLWRRVCIFFLIMTLIAAASFSKTEERALRYCIPIKNNFDFNPFRRLSDGKELTYLFFLRSYISTDQKEMGLLKSYEFSPDGKIFTGRVNPLVKWSDGSPLTPWEAAIGIAKGLKYRPIGSRVSVKGTEKITKPGWESRSYTGIKIVNFDTFEIRFESPIENLTGILRESLSTGSRHNRMWPVKLVSHTNQSKVTDVIAIYNVIRLDNSVGFLVGKQPVLLVRGSQCKDADFSLYPESLSANLSRYEARRNANPQEVSMQLNTSRLNYKTRRALVGWIRAIFGHAKKSANIDLTDSFFLEGEPGYSPGSIWQTGASISLLKKKQLTIATEIPIFHEIIKESASLDKLNIKIVDLPTTEKNLDAQVLSSEIRSGRHIILQDILKWEHVSDLMKSAPKTRQSLELITKQSESTMPTDKRTLQEFERNSLIEQSIANIGRRFPTAFSKKTSPLSLEWTEKNELVLKPRDKQ